MRVSKILFSILLIAVFSGCGGKKKEGPKPEAPANASAEPAAAAPAGPAEAPGAPPSDPNAGPSLDKFRMGRDQASDGAVLTEVDRLIPSEKLFVSFVIRNPAPQSEVKVTWSNLKTAKVVAEETKALPASGLIWFEAAGAGTWERGGYRLEIALSSAGKPSGAIGRKDFELVAKR